MESATERFGKQKAEIYTAREDFAADLIFYTGKSKDNRFMALIQKMVPNPIGDARLAFNLACLHALNGNKQKMLHYTKIALFLGMNVLELKRIPTSMRFAPIRILSE
ncbi:hypothetical protein MY480_10190 [Leptospira borgpetersenii]|nr:hypothetical protein MY480_10190 [Leptospira borgpetersenii]